MNCFYNWMERRLRNCKRSKKGPLDRGKSEPMGKLIEVQKQLPREFIQGIYVFRFDLVQRKMENVPEEALEGETEEVEEIVEIIEEIEEIEEFVDEESENTNVKKGHQISDSQVDDDSQEDSENEHGEMFKVSNNLQNRRSYGRKKAVVTYDPDDWEDEENEHYQGGGLHATKGQMAKNSSLISSIKKTHSMNGKRSREDDRSLSNRTSTEPVYKVVKTRTMDYANARNNSNSLEEDDEEDEEEEEEQEGEREHEQELEQEQEQEQEEEEDYEEEEEESQHEIVKSAENNLLYTVLGSKKSSSGTGKTKKDNSASQVQESARYMKMERVDDETIPIEGTIYYEGDNMETVYVAQSTNEDNEQYHYEDQQNEQVEQEWEEAHEDANENQAQQEAEEEPVQQDQIFLHEDEDGQLYFKDDSGTLQPVYLTADGNYAIAENSSDEQEVQENTNNRQAALTSSTTTDTDKGFDDDNFIVPELDGAASGSNTNDPENEDNTVTISLIISEDENGQKRTQVIIPTTDNLKCELCAKSFKTSFQLLRHNRLKHAREEDITTRNFPCDLCPKRYSDQNTLARHRKTHLGDRPFGCLECGKSFPTSTALRRHLTQHNPQSRPLPCIYCGRRFSEKSALTQHEQSHLAGDQRTHMCDICHKSFLQAADLNLHKKNHDPNKKFDCEVCGREFNRLNNLQRHMMVHKQKQGGNQEILACDVCGITYKFMSSLTRHMVTSHMNPEKLRQQAEEQRKKRENNYRRYLENRKMYETQHTGADYTGAGGKRSGGYRSSNDNDEDTA